MAEIVISDKDEHFYHLDEIGLPNLAVYKSTGNKLYIVDHGAFCLRASGFNVLGEMVELSGKDLYSDEPQTITFTHEQYEIIAQLLLDLSNK